MLGDGRTAALVAADGRLDWWPFPTLDGPPVCAALLDPVHGGHFALAPEDPFEMTRRYIPDTNVLETTYCTSSGAVRVTQGLNTGAAGRLPWTEFAHRIEGIAGVVTMVWELIPGDRFGQTAPRVELYNGRPVVSIKGQTLSVVLDCDEPCTADDAGLAGRFRVSPAQRVVLAIVATEREPLFIPSPAAIDARLDRTIRSWRDWTNRIQVQGPWANAVKRSALALKTILLEKTGAIAAAATTSLPERIGGDKNWDYRYAWVRDSSFTLDALINLGLHEEVHGALSWLLDALRRNGSELRVFYTLEGDAPGPEETLEVPGYRDSQPVRSGNAAGRQSQLGTYGDFFDTIFRYCSEGHILDPGTGQLLCQLADECSRVWMKPDSGIWELSDLEHYTISKIGAWVALDRAWRLASLGQVPAQQASTWKETADEIQSWVREHCWSERKRSYTFFAGTDRLDAAVLLAGRTGFDRGVRLKSTADAISEELGHDSLFYRYSGMAQEEGAFVACSFWMVEALVYTDQRESARNLMDAAVQLTNDLGLLSEQIDPLTGEFLGNFPQGLSHLALINAAYTLGRG